MNKTQIVAAIILASSASALVASVVATRSPVPVRHRGDEISRQPSPDGKTEAVVMESNGGATTSFGYQVYILARGQSPTIGYENFSADHVQGLEVVWKTPKLLHIRYKSARIFQFSNFWHTEELQAFNYIVELRLVPTASPYSLMERDR